MAKWGPQMKPRWAGTGYLERSWGTGPVRVHTALSPTDEIAFHQRPNTCHPRMEPPPACPVHPGRQRGDRPAARGCRRSGVSFRPPRQPGG